MKLPILITTIIFAAFLYYANENYPGSKNALLKESINTSGGQELEKLRNEKKEIIEKVEQFKETKSEVKSWHQFTKTYCVDCHGPKKKKGKFRIDTLSLNEIAKNSETWYEIYEQIEKGDMPPEDSLQPSKKTKELLLAFLDKKMMTNTGSESKGTLRRLTKSQLVNTLEDLFKRKVHPKLIDKIPTDKKKHAFDTLHSKQIMSSVNIKSLQGMSIKILDDVIVKNTTQAPPVRTVDLNKLRPDGVSPYGQYPGNFVGHLHEGSQLDLVLNQKIEYNYLNLEEGYYNVTFDVDSLYRKLDPGFAAKVNSTFNNSYQYTGEYKSILRLTLLTVPSVQPPSTIFVEDFELDDHKRQVINRKIFIPANYRPCITWANGPHKPSWTYYDAVGDKPSPKFIRTPLTTPAEKKAERQVWTTKRAMFADFIGRSKTPRLQIYDFKLKGPINDVWPPQSHQVIYNSNEDKESLRNFAEKAFRRPVSVSEISPFYGLLDNSKESLQRAATALLCSSSFLYHFENSGQLDNYALASRLSYTLWDSMPDTELYELAKNGKIRNPKVYEEQITRLMADKKFQRFIDSFVDQWLKLDSMPTVSKEKHPIYYFHDAKKFLKREPKEFIKFLIKHNKPTIEMITANYSLINRNLSKFYKKKIESRDFKVVTFTEKEQRGGLLGMGAIHAASANGLDTSAILRGVYVAERILGDEPPPPPEGVEIVPPDLRSATDIKDMVKKHSKDPSCRNCHKKIDYLGFALEGFNAGGVPRGSYGHNKPIDTSGVSPKGKKFKNLVELKVILGSQQKDINKAFIERFLIYATGRKMTHQDRSEINRILNTLSRNNYPMKDLLTECLKSKVFINK